MNGKHDNPNEETTKQQRPIAVVCPIEGAFQAPPYQIEELNPLLEAISKGEVPNNDIQHFQRGSLRNDGYIDCCKQALGVAGTHQLTHALKQNQHIKGILFGTDGLGDEGASKVAEMLQENKQLETLYLGCNYIGSKGASALAMALENHSSIKNVWLKRNPLGPAGVQALAEMLKSNIQLKCLDLVNTLLGKEGLSVLLNTIKSNHPSLERLYLGGNNLGVDEAIMIADFLEENQKIKALHIGVNALGDKGAILIANSLKKNTHLQELGIPSNGIGIRGAIPLIQALQIHPRIEHVNIGYSRSTRALGGTANTLDDMVAPYIADWLKQTTRLRYLDIAHNEMSNQGFRLILDALQNNHYLQHLWVGKGFHGKMKDELRQLLSRNAANKGDYKRWAEEVTAIRSVYR